MPETLATPRFVLKHELQSIGPSLCGIESAQYSYVLYGFSDKPNYDLFRSEDSRLLKPYPLVKRFMMDELHIGECPSPLIALNAEGPNQETIYASSMRNVLEAFQQNQETVTITHVLKLDPNTKQYDAQRI